MSTEKRLFLFLALTFVVLAGYSAMTEFFGPQRPLVDQWGPAAGNDPADPQQPPGQAPELAPGKVPAADGTAATLPSAERPEHPAGSAAETSPEKSPEKSPAGPPEKTAAIDVPTVHPHRVVSLGNYRPASTGSPLLVTLTSRGAGLERVELVERIGTGGLHYQDLDQRHGYLGNLSLIAEGAETGGCRIHVVPAGSPAAAAVASGGASNDGLRVGDLLKSVNSQPMEVPDDLDRELQRLRPGDTAKLTVERTVEGKSQRIEFTAILDIRPFELIHPESLDPNEAERHPNSLLLSVRSAEREKAPFVDQLRDVEWETREIETGVEFRCLIPEAAAERFGLQGPVEVIKRFRLGASSIAQPEQAIPIPAYHLDFEIELQNRGSAPQSLTYRLEGTNGLPTEGWWYLTKIHPQWFQSAGARDVVLHTASDGHRLLGCSKILQRMKKDEKAPFTPLFSEKEPTPNRSLAYIGIDTQYFAAALRPLNATQAIPADTSVGNTSVGNTATGDTAVGGSAVGGSAVGGSAVGGSAATPVLFSRAEALAWGDLTKKPKGWDRTANASFQLSSESITVASGTPFVQKFQLFLGPKDPRVLAAYGLQEWIYYGWFGWIARVLSGVLHFFYAIIGNYGIAIILLTVLVRSCMFPISRTAARNAAMMQELAPEMRKIAEKFKNNLEARGKAQQELFRKHNYNPLSGCWLMFLQLPVFIGLYRCLAIDIELRQAPLIPGVEWCSNLAGPDKLFFWKADYLAYFTDESGWLGPFFNLLPIFTIILFLLHQKLFTPPATDEQTAMQMKMMKFMTVFMGVLFYKVPAGLCLYFITSSLWGIAERKLLPKATPKKDNGGGRSFNLASLLQPRKPPADDNGTDRKKELERKLRRNK